MKRISLLAAAITTLCLSGTALAEVFAFIRMPLTPSQEVPAVTSTGYGSVTALYDNVTKILTYNVTWRLNESATVTDAHLHSPSAVGGASAPVSVTIPTTALLGTNSGRTASAVTLTAAQETDLLAGNMYFNIHSTFASGGELRGQMIQNPDGFGTFYHNFDIHSTTLAGVLSVEDVIVRPGIAGKQVYNADLTFNGRHFNLIRVEALR